MRLARDQRGSTIVEFAIIAPTLGFLLVVAFQVSQVLYMKTTLQGIVQKSARDSALEVGSDAAAQALNDAKVKAQVLALANNATVKFNRRFYRTFSQAAAAKAESFTDTNHNGRCDAGEPYQDDNGNNVWDADGGDDGQGGAKDRTLYTVTVSYPSIFTPSRTSGIGAITLTTQTVLENQPYSDQDSYGAPVVRNCP